MVYTVISVTPGFYQQTPSQAVVGFDVLFTSPHIQGEHKVSVPIADAETVDMHIQDYIAKVIAIMGLGSEESE